MPISRRSFIKRALVLATGFLAAKAFWFEKFFIETNEFFLRNATKTSFGLKVVQISDLHIQSVGYALKRMAAQVNAHNPDVICLTGDAVDKAEKLPVLQEFLSLLNKNTPKVAILGNWEYWGKVNLPDLKQLYETHNCQLLVNQSVQIPVRDKAVSITGTDDFLGGNADFGTAITDYKPGDYHIVLNHCPQYSDTIVGQFSTTIPMDFILSGHTHGGQINLLGFIPFLPRGSGRYVHGWYGKSPAMYVSKGIGTSILPIRFGARAEIAVFYL